MMFQGLTQGSVVTVFYRNTPKVLDGKVLSVNTHLPVFNPQQPMALMNGPVTDITVQTADETIPFAGLPANGVVANFPEKGLFLSIDKSAVIREVESQAAAAKQILESVPAQQKMLRDCESLLLELNPDKRREVKHDQEITNLRSEITELRNLIRESLGQIKKEN